MAYRAVFIAVGGLDEIHLDPHYGLAAATREEAEKEALALTPPDGADFVKLFLDGHYEPPKIGLPFDA